MKAKCITPQQFRIHNPAKALTDTISPNSTNWVDKVNIICYSMFSEYAYSVIIVIRNRPQLRAALVEQFRTLEDAFSDLMR